MSDAAKPPKRGPPAARNGRILMIDDQEANLQLLDRLLRREGYSTLRSLSDPRAAADVFQEFKPDLVLLDLQMPHLDGFGVLDLLRPLIPAETYLPIVIITGDTSIDARKKALSSGAKDFLTKPYEPVEVVLRVHNLLETRRLHLELQSQNERLDIRVRERTADLERARLETIERLARAAEYRDDDTGQHARRVGEVSALVAAEMGFDARYVELLLRAAPLHDVGKIGIPDAILLKPRVLTPEEFAVIRTHTEIGAEILSGSSSPVLQLAAEIARYHHERWDGTGYVGLAGEDIPLVGRIVTVVDTFDALISERPYKRPWTRTEALEEIRRVRGTQLDPTVVDSFLRVHDAHPAAFPQS
jgi:putative two-component system response regulator